MSIFKKSILFQFIMNFFQYNPQSQILQAVDIPLPAALSDIECLDHNLVQHRVEEARRYKYDCYYCLFF